MPVSCVFISESSGFPSRPAGNLCWNELEHWCPPVSCHWLYPCLFLLLCTLTWPTFSPAKPRIYLLRHTDACAGFKVASAQTQQVVVHANICTETRLHPLITLFALDKNPDQKYQLFPPSPAWQPPVVNACCEINCYSPSLAGLKTTREKSVFGLVTLFQVSLPLSG